MRVVFLISAAVAAAMVPMVAQADDPLDPSMRSAAARARDRELTRQLNLQEMARVRQRDAHRHAAGAGDHAARSRDHDRAMALYARNQAEYERELADWRRAVAACRAGDYSACDGY